MSLAWLIGASLAAGTPQTGNAEVDAFVGDVAAGRRDAAIARILELNSISGRPNAVALVSEFVDKLLRCTFVSSETRDFGGSMYDVRWHCPDGDYFSLLDGDYRPHRLVVGEFVSAETREQRRRTPMPPPMPTVANGPRLSDGEKMRIVITYLDDIRPGGAGTSAAITFRLHFMDERQPDSFISPGQLGRYLAPCQRSEPQVVQGGRFAGGVVMRWACAGRDALAPEFITVMNIYQGQVMAGTVMAGPVPEPAG